MLGYADIICIEVLSVFILKLFDIGYKCFNLSYDVFLSFKTFSDALFVFEIAGSVFFVYTAVYDKFNIYYISIDFMFGKLRWIFDFFEKFFIYSIKKVVICSTVSL